MVADDFDLALVERANRGDERAFTEIYQRHRDWVARTAFRFCGDRDDALDVLQDTFAYLFGRFPGFVLTAQLRTYLYPIIKHQSFDRRRRRGAEPAFHGEPAVAPEPSPDRLDAERLLSLLPEEQREVTRLRFADDMSLADIAAALQIPVGTVKSRLHNALATLRLAIAEGTAANAQRGKIEARKKL
jgi:RNA polymerase sigma-70 factor (ECF subfamily)